MGCKHCNNGVTQAKNFILEKTNLSQWLSATCWVWLPVRVQKCDLSCTPALEVGRGIFFLFWETLNHSWCGVLKTQSDLPPLPTSMACTTGGQLYSPFLWKCTYTSVVEAGRADTASSGYQHYPSENNRSVCKDITHLGHHLFNLFFFFSSSGRITAVNSCGIAQSY